MTSASNSPGSYLSSKTRSPKIDDNYLKELSEDLKLRKQELLEMLKPLEDKNKLLFQKLMSNLEERQRSLQIMRQIMAGKGNGESSVIELIKEAEEMKQNLERKNKMLRKEMEMLWNKTFSTEELSDQQKALQIKNKADLQDRKAPQTPSSSRKTKNELETLCAEEVKEIRKEKQQRKMEWVRYQEQANFIQNDFNGKVIALRIEALKNYQKPNDLKLSLYIQQNFEPKQAFFNLHGSRGTMDTATMSRATTGKSESNVKITLRILGAKTYTEQQGAKGSQFDEGRGRLFFLRSRPEEALKD
ncbi:putative coiled-coil domain-containing protein 196 [Delphinapterus leucas]|uniref:Coiled-coil domain-containing protein 196 n=1 Tax=Delphinapterus leucas TaxID=9749 RepID=A0A2Y9MVN7_DELLE|nr:putative coiled-coil domain-containing protein 196 [Delphinapterus leucas]